MLIGTKNKILLRSYQLLIDQVLRLTWNFGRPKGEVSGVHFGISSAIWMTANIIFVSEKDIKYVKSVTVTQLSVPKIAIEDTKTMLVPIYSKIPSELLLPQINDTQPKHLINNRSLESKQK